MYGLTGKTHFFLQFINKVIKNIFAFTRMLCSSLQG
jgi:hypothetical protein